MHILTPETERDFELYYDLRWRVLRAPWNQPRGTEKDNLESTASHVMVCEIDRIPVGIGRVHLNSPHEAQIRYMAVEPSHEGRGIGKIVIARLEEIAIQQGAQYIVLNARETAIPFYTKRQYIQTGPAPTMFGVIKHVAMHKNIAN